MITLPDTLSGLLEVAYNDLLGALGTGHFRFKFMVYLSPEIDGVCAGCLAGASLYQRGCRHQDDAPKELWPKLQAISNLSLGQVQEAARLIKVETRVADRFIAYPKLDNLEWHDKIKQLLADLKAAGA